MSLTSVIIGYSHPPARSFVFCRQRQDASLRRGGEQLSVIVLSEHPLSSVLKPLSQVAGAMFFSHGGPALEQVRSYLDEGCRHLARAACDCKKNSRPLS